MEHDHRIHDSHPNQWRTARTGGLFIMGAIGAYFLLTKHYTHVLDALPFLLLLACPLMHIFMHYGHGNHGNHSTAERQSSESQDHPQTK
jgi:hypothetical protein